MHKFFVSKQNIDDYNAVITGDDVKHIYKVLRLQENDTVIINDTEGTEYEAEISEINKKEVIVKLIKKLDINNESKIRIHLFQGMPKGQKMELIIQKCTELGVNFFYPLITERTDIKLKGEYKKIDRLNRIALEASKQCKRSVIPKVFDAIDFKSANEYLKNMDLIVVPYENEEKYGIKKIADNVSLDIKDIAVIIGPEGGFEESEIEYLKEINSKIVTLGNRILRTETAAITTCGIIQYVFGDLG
ncbi:16S rRNA (uracil(1498)-N(3))-methyltransferase [Clostridium sp. BJN0001]|uniref:16S rRNA (uracil(1498)-N(3))-methyltransferase n=1 Tax=Clostridium sp. BJN0001 TaxID=2930219 RepID=UPI001FD489C7|nr:16S rRNA (uracil(1498)-N(3))-methyltransferase [Clostridium sp. BJN0001]